MFAIQRGMMAEARPPAPAAAPDDDALLAAIAVGDRAAFRSLMERHAGRLIGLAHRVTGSAQDADDVVQEAFAKVWVQAGRWRPDGGARFSTWIYRVVLNLCIDRRRKRKMSSLDEAGDPADPGPGGFDQVSAGQRAELVRRALERLPERQREALALYYFGDMTAPEAAAKLSLSLSAFEALLFRGRQSLKTSLRRLGVAGIGDVL